MTRVKPRHVLVDMDGTLVDTEGLKCEAWRLAVGDAEGVVPDDAEHRVLYATLAGAPAMAIGASLIEHHRLDVSSEELHEMRERHRRQFYADPLELARRVNGSLVDVIVRLRDGATVLGGGEVVLVTTAPRDQVDAVMEATGLRELFDEIVCGLEKSVENPACYRAALEALGGASPEECLAIEDTTVGYSAAQALGIPCLLLPNEYTRGQKL